MCLGVFMSKKKEKEEGKEKVVKAWTGAIGGIIFWAVLGHFLFDWAWWVFFLMAMSVSHPIKVTIEYYQLESRKCPVCSQRLDLNAKFCRTCGTQIVNSCPHCGVHVKELGLFCET